MSQVEEPPDKEREDEDEDAGDDSTPSRLERVKMVLEMVWITVRLLGM